MAVRGTARGAPGGCNGAGRRDGGDDGSQECEPYAVTLHGGDPFGWQVRITEHVDADVITKMYSRRTSCGKLSPGSSTRGTGLPTMPSFSGDLGLAVRESLRSNLRLPISSA